MGILEINKESQNYKISGTW